VDAVQRRVRLPGALGTHGADLHADSAHTQLDREGERSDAVNRAFTVSALDGYARHVLLAPP
jgi:hypothetical protein